MPVFETWDRATLNKFAYEAYAKMQAQEERLQQLQNELKDAIEAYRAFMRKGAFPPGQ